MTLKQLVNTEQYLKHFYKRRNLSTIGNSYFCFACKHSIPLRTNGKPTYARYEEKICPHCSSTEVTMALPKSLQGTNSGNNVYQIYCKYHGKFNSNDFFNLRHVFEILDDPPPPDIQLKKRPKPISTLINSPRMDLVDSEGNILKVIYNKRLKIRAAPIKKQEKRFMDTVQICTVKRNICSSCFKEYHKEDMQPSGGTSSTRAICKFCHNNERLNKEHHIRKVSRHASAKNKQFDINDKNLVNFEDKIKLASTGKC